MGGLTLRGDGVKARALRAAFPRTVPILAGFLFLGMAYGVYMHVLGFSFWYPVVMAVVIFGGSLEFVAGTLLLSPFAPVQAFFIASMIQARHLFYGLSMLEKYKGLGAKRIYLIYGLCDETFSIAYTTRLPQDVDRGWFYFFVTLLNQLYWVAGTALGSLAGGLMSFDTAGLGFVMTAMFVVIFLEQFLHEKQHISAAVGFFSAGVCLFFFGADDFLIPTMALILLLLTALRRPIVRKGGFR